MYTNEFVKYDEREKCNIYRIKNYVLFKVYDNGRWEIKTSGSFCNGQSKEDYKEFSNILSKVYEDNFKEVVE